MKERLGSVTTLLFVLDLLAKLRSNNMKHFNRHSFASLESDSIDTEKAVIMLVYCWGRGNDGERSELTTK